MTVDQLDELIRKYLSTGVAMVLVLVAPATASNGGTVRSASDPTRQSTNAFLHHRKDNAQERGLVKVDATQWHNWAVEWTPKGATTYVDGKPWWHTDNTAALPPGPMHLCIQLDWFPQNTAQKAPRAVTPSQMQVDWVRQYPLDATSPTPAPTSTPTPDNSAMRDVVRRTFGW